LTTTDTSEQEPDTASGRIVLLVTSPRTAPGLLSWPAWAALREADVVLAADLDPVWQDALAEAEVPVEDVLALPVGQRAGRLVEQAGQGLSMVWFGSPDADPGLTDALADHLARRAIADVPPEIEVVTGSHDLPGARLLDLVAVMDRLRSPGGCPWDARQTHASLLPYLLEEAHEVMEAVERDDSTHLSEELGDLLLQVAFHARVAQEHPSSPFDIDDVAGGIVAKLVRRHPHVFGGADVATAEDVERSWHELKAAEKQREGLFEGIPGTLPALARAQKMLERVARSSNPEQAAATAAAQDDVARVLLDAVLVASGEGRSAETLLRSALHRLAEASDGTMET
jgi:XTP/dITP diphosphohydrolase